ncbi:flagellar biosynthesis protein FlgL [Geomonas sp. RF6]|uniref:flagellin N-terminal helical domain-containing protein n=1 Tax=Geomonas sp. RF6 TaxID=2897342 RepID=UPI001E3A76B9|nr:flagellin [Geomonas sp. RF6]UFS72410.1 flagellar biosynthesis protein FlgL [Geomonas sp. RF6]
MRITPGMSAENAVYNLQQQRNAIDALQEQIGSGFQINRPSDNPLSARQILDMQNQISQGEQYSSNITKATMSLNVMNVALTGMNDVMNQVASVASSMTNGNTNAADRTQAVNNLANLKAQLIDYANSQNGSQYVFGGYAGAPPFDSTGNFSGTDDSIMVDINKGSQVAVNYSGSALLRGGNPPAAVGSGATAGTSPVDVLGSIDALMTAITANNATGISDGFKNIHAAQDQMNAAQTDIAGRLVRLDNMTSMISNSQATLKDVMGNMQNVDYAKAAVQLSQQTTAFNAALSTVAKIGQLSLLDYLR